MSRLRRAVLGALPPLLAAPAFAQIREETPVLVTAPRPALTVPGNEQARVNLQLSPGSNSVVPASEFLERAGTVSLRDMLEYTPGVFAQPKFGEDSRLSIRGSGLARNFHLRGVRLLQDGIPVNQADGSGDFQEIDPLALQRVEVLRGGNAFALGANSLGGALNFVTPTGRDAPGAQARVEAGSNGFLRGQAAYGLAAGNWDSWVSGVMSRSDGWRRQSAGDAGRMNANLGWRWADNAETRIFLGYNAIFQQIPGTLSRFDALNNPRRANPANFANNYQRNIISLRLGTRTAIQLNPETLLEFGGSFVNRTLNHPIFQFVDNRTNDFNAFGRVTWDGQVAGLRNRLVAGVNYAYGTNDNLRFVNVRGFRGAPTFSAWDTASTLDAYAENSLYVLPNLALVAGLSGGRATRASENRFNAALGGSGEWAWINPRAGVLWQVTPTVQGFANLTWSTEPPTLSDLVALVPQGGFSLLKPQRARTLEGGFRGRLGPVEFEAVAYRAWIDKEIQLFLGPTPGSSFARNADRTIHQGVELAGTWQVARSIRVPDDGLTLRGAYTFSDFRFDRDARFGNNELPGNPPHLLRGEARYRFPVPRGEAWVAPTLEWSPAGFFADNANTLRGNPYALLGLRAGAELLDGRLSVFAELRNLTDRRYLASASVLPVATPASAVFEPGLGRMGYAGLRMRF
jgi:iron complex outermembrane receptor protein